MAWSFSFELNTKKQVTLNEGVLEQSSLAQFEKEIEKTEYQALKNLNNNELLKKLEKNRAKWNKPTGDFALSLSALETIEKKSKKSLPKRFEDNPVFKLLEKLSDSTVSLEYEDIIACNADRQFYENKLELYPDLRWLSQRRQVAANDFKPECVTYSMNQFQIPKTNYAVCARSNGSPNLPGSKPCVTPKLVHLTYNIFKDITECLNLDAKQLMPKIDFESGFFINAYGSDHQSGIGQLTKSAIEDVNQQLDYYINEVEKAAPQKKSCAQVLKIKKYFSKASSNTNQRCSLIGLPENPARNIFYSALFNKINAERIAGIKYVAGRDYINTQQGLVPVQNNEQDEFAGFFEKYDIKNKLSQLGLAKINLTYFKDLIVLLGYNTGAETAFKLLNEYLDKRIENNLTLSWKDFDFYNPNKLIDLDNKEKDEVEVARSYVMSSIINANDSPELKQIKLQKRIEFPKQWLLAYTRSFPVYLALRANSYSGNSTNTYAIYGYPGYLNVLVDRNINIETLFKSSDIPPSSCINPDFLKVPQTVIEQ